MLAGAAAAIYAAQSASPALNETDSELIGLAEFITVYLTGGLLYGLLELLWRGWTHWSMIICGGACFAAMYRINFAPIPFPAKCLLCACTVTAIEFAVGCLVNIILKWQVWDYSALRGNLMGQICPQFFLMWLALSVPGLCLCSLLSRLLGRYQ